MLHRTKTVSYYLLRNNDFPLTKHKNTKLYHPTSILMQEPLSSHKLELLTHQGPRSSQFVIKKKRIKHWISCSEVGLTLRSPYGSLSVVLYSLTLSGFIAHQQPEWCWQQHYDLFWLHLTQITLMKLFALQCKSSAEHSSIHFPFKYCTAAGLI